MNATPISPIIHVLMCMPVRIKFYTILSPVPTTIVKIRVSSPQGSVPLFFYNHMHLLLASPTPIPNPWQLILLHFCNFAISRMSHKWNHTVCDLLILAFFTHHWHFSYFRFGPITNKDTMNSCVQDFACTNKQTNNQSKFSFLSIK